MSLSVPSIVLTAKQREIEELNRVMARSLLVGATGHMIHVLQSERGASSIFLASSGQRFEDTRRELVSDSEAVERQLRNLIEAELEDSSFANAKIISLFAWVLLGLDALPDLRKRIDKHELTGSEAIAAFSRLIAGLISLIFEVADAAIDPDISQLLVALFNLVQGKEFAGQERAVGAMVFASGTCSELPCERILHLVAAQDHHFRIFSKFAEAPIAAHWEDIQNAPYVAELRNLRRLLTSSTIDTALDPDLSDTWFQCCTDRITSLWELQCELIDSLQQRCTTLIAEAERGLLDSEGLIKALRDNPPAGAGLVDRFFDPALPVEQSLTFVAPGETGQRQAQSVIELLQAQSRRLANMESELSSARRALNERKTIERAKGILMARFSLSEDEAYKRMRTTSMQQNRRLVDVAESVLSLNELS
jgi:hypothetical protein